MLHGATMGTNFGDFLFAHLFYNKVCEVNKTGETYFYESKYAMSPFFKKNLNYQYNYSKTCKRKADLLIYISGGYFGERENNTKEHILRFLRYFTVGLYFSIMKKPIIIIGVGAGPLSSWWLRFFTRKIFNNADLITVRDKESKEYLEKYGVKKKIIITSDSAQAIPTDYCLHPIDEYLTGKVNKNKKYVFLHVNPYVNSNNSIVKKIVPPLNKFLSKHKEYGVIIGCDQYSGGDEGVDYVRNYVKCDDVILYKYSNPLTLCSLLKEVDLIITTKLHVGVIGATFSKSVISISGHSEKIHRYYRQIGQSERTISLLNCSEEEIFQLLNKYHNIPIVLDDEVFNLAQLNTDLLQNYILSKCD